MSNKRGEACGRRLRGTAQAAGGPVEGAVLAVGFRGQQGWGGSPAALGPEQSALALGLGRGGPLGQQRGQGRQGRQRRRVLPGLLLDQGLGLGVSVGRRAGDALLLATPGVVVGGVADVVVDKGVGLLSARIHLVFAVAALVTDQTWMTLDTLA